MNGRHRWVVMVAALLAVAILVAIPLWQNAKLSDQADKTADVAAQNRALVVRLERQRVADDEAQAATLAEVCRKTNYALRANREAIAAAEAALINVLRMSPHSAAVADQVASSLPPLPTAEQTDSDCNGDGQLTAEDYGS